MQRATKDSPATNRGNPLLAARRLSRRTVGTVEACGNLVREQGMRPLWATFRDILLVVFLILVFAIVQMFMLWRVCNTGMKTATSLEHQGLPMLNELATLQENLAIFRLYSYEYLFAQEEDRVAKAKAVETTAANAREHMERILALLPEGEGRRLVSNLEGAFDDLNAEFRKVRMLVESDFAAAMRTMDQNIPARVQQAADAAGKLKDYGYRFSGAQTNATFGSFGWIKKNAIMFGTANILVAFGAVVFVLLAARRSRAQLTYTLARLDERTHELTSSLSMVNATLESTADGILLIDANGKIGKYNLQFVRMWGVAKSDETMKDKKRLMAFALPLLKHADKFADKAEDLEVHPEHESSDVLELHDGRTFECHSKPQRIEDQISGRVWSFRDISEQKRMQREVDKTQQELLLASRQAGMAEVATGVLHNVGNVLNSVNISTSQVIESLTKSQSTNVGRLGELLTQKADDLAAFVTTDPTGRQLPAYVNRLAGRLNLERDTLLKECGLIRTNVDHIKDIVSMQQSYAKAFGVVEKVKVSELIEDALRMNAGALTRHGFEVVRDFEEPECSITVEKHKVLQILVNLIRNAKHACEESSQGRKTLTICSRNGQGLVRIEVIDNGVGIPPENMTRIFNHGFTTRKTGHGFGLHSAALAAKEMGGSLVAHSDGPQRGATFVLELPLFQSNQSP